MSLPAGTDWAPTFTRILGDELRRERSSRGWTRKVLVEHLTGEQDIELSLQTLATYELGTRHLTVLRLIEVCTALGVSALDVLTRAWGRVFVDDEQVPVWTIDLVATARLEDLDLVPLTRWAANRLLTHPKGEPTIARLDRAAMQALAVLCGLDPLELARRLPALYRQRCRSSQKVIRDGHDQEVPLPGAPL